MFDLSQSLSFLFQFDEPTSRLYHVNLFSSLLLVAFVALILTPKKTDPKRLLKHWILRKKYWWNASTKQDYFIYIFNGLFKALLLVPLLECSFVISRWTVSKLIFLSADHDTLNLPASHFAIAVFTAAVFVWDDFLRFFHHYLMHRVPFLWEFHKTHHSARILTPITLFRAHPVESVIAILRNSLSLGVASGFFVFTFGSTMNLWTLLGVNAFGFLFNLVGANLRHSHIRLGFGAFENIVISPLQHQIHHSTKPEHYDKNFGVTLAIWDKLFGTLIKSKGIGKLSFGLREPFQKSFSGMLLNPLKKVFKA